MTAAAKLRVVQTPEEELAALFAAERELERDLADTRVGIAAARAAYARKHGLIAMPRVETLRRLVGQ